MVLIKEDPEGIAFKVYIQPRSSQNMIVGPHGDTIKIKLTAPPVDNAANKMCIEYLAKILRVPKSAVEIVSGHSGRTKWIRLKYQHGLNADQTKQNSMKQRVYALLGS